MKNLLLILFLSFFCANSFGQDKISKVTYLPLDSLVGTYQIQIIQTRAQPLIPQDLNVIIQRNRKLKKSTEVMLASDLRLIILSEEEIRRKDFKPLEPIIRIQN